MRALPPALRSLLPARFRTRRMHMQGEAKAMLDPFRPEDPADVARLRALQEDVQAVFTDLVRSRRPNLKPGENLFTGAVWTGRSALALGLMDALGDIRSTLRARFGEEVEIRLIAEARGSFIARLLRRAAPGGTGLADEALSAIEERAAWVRLGL